MGATPHTKMEIRFGKAEILEKGIGHIQVIILTGMNNNGMGPVLLFQGVAEGGDFHEVGPGCGDEVDEHVRWDRWDRWDR